MIAVFDSGYGGLTVLKPIMDLLPEYDYLYLGDNARAPYGNYSQENIAKFSEEAVEYLFDRGATLIIFACNTVSSAALRKVQQKYLKGKDEKDRKILGVLIPVAEEVAKKNRIGVVGTKATIESKAYDKEIHKVNPDAKVFSKACPLLVPLIEENWHTKPEARSILKKYIMPLKSKNIDTLVLGCTHYSIMQKDFERYMGKKVSVVPSGETTAKSLKKYLERHPEIEGKISKNKKREFLTTDSPEKFKTFAEKILSAKIKPPQKVDLTPIQ